MADLKALGGDAKAWPFAEARTLLQRPVRAAAYRHLWRSGAHDDGPPRLRDDLRHPDAAVCVFRRHGRAAQGPRQRPQPGDDGAASGQAADPGARSVRHARKLRAPQQRPAAGVSGYLRLRVRIPQRDRLLPVGRVRCDPARNPAAARRHHGGDQADPRPGAARNLQPVSAGLPAHRAR